MSKPDGIPQDVWDYAHKLHMDEGMLTFGKPNVTRLVARAIMAEREACARQAEDFARRVMPKDHRSYVFDLAAAIRNRGTMETTKTDHCGCVACEDGTNHMSDCAVHNEPAYPNGPCDCGATLNAHDHNQAVSISDDEVEAGARAMLAIVRPNGGGDWRDLAQAVRAALSAASKSTKAS